MVSFYIGGQRGLPEKMTFEQRSAGSEGGTMCISGGKSVPGKGRSKCKGPEASTQKKQ